MSIGKNMFAGCCCENKKDGCASEHHLNKGDMASLAELAPGQGGIVTRTNRALRAAQKFADIGMIKGARVLLEAYAPFGGLLRVRLLNSSMVLHSAEAQHIMVEVE